MSPCVQITLASTTTHAHYYIRISYLNHIFTPLSKRLTQPIVQLQKSQKPKSEDKECALCNNKNNMCVYRKVLLTSLRLKRDLCKASISEAGCVLQWCVLQNILYKYLQVYLESVTKGFRVRETIYRLIKKFQILN